jgi:tRNA-splicing ligase RtcB
MKLIDGIPVWGEPDPGALRQIKVCAQSADKVALMADHHLGYAVPIGGVVAYKDSISPSGVGFDIGCGNKAVLTDMTGAELRPRVAEFMDAIYSTISFGIGRKNNERVEHELFDLADGQWQLEATKPLKDKAIAQLGTIGSGNHYVDLFTDESDRVWIGVHFGSRGFGHGIATWFLKAAGAKDGMEVDPCVLEAKSDLGQQYITAMEMGGIYAYAGRNWVCSKVAQIMGTNILEEVHNHHNYAWRETHGGEDLWVVRKGATPAFPGQKGFVGGTMFENAVILEGIENDEADLSLYSTVHGAGRVVGRMEAKGKTKYDKATGVTTVVREGKINQGMMDDWQQRAGVELRGGGLDESPHCYKRLAEVLAEHSKSVRILHTLTPAGVAMAGKDVFDPFKD